MAESVARVELCANMNFIPNKKQFRWNGDLKSLKDFWKEESETVC